MSDVSQTFKNGDRVVMVASYADEGDPPDGTTGVVVNANSRSFLRVKWDDWTNSASTNDWYVFDDQITHVVSPP